MKTTTSIKIDTKVKQEATELANELGVSFSAVVNSMLKSFIRERRLVLSVEPELNEKTKKEYDAILRDIKSGKNLSPVYTNVADLMKALKK